MIIFGVGIILHMVAVHVISEYNIQIMTAILGSVIMILSLVQYMRQYLKELKLGPVRFE